MSSHDWGILALRLTAVYLFVQALFWSGATLFLAAVIPFDFRGVDDGFIHQLKLAACTALPAAQCYVIGRWYWKDAAQITAPRVELSSHRRIADDKIAPVLIVALALWGVVRLIPATRELSGNLFASDYTGRSFAESWSEPIFRYRFYYQLFDFFVASLAAVAARPLIALLMSVKRRIGRPGLPEQTATSATA